MDVGILTPSLRGMVRVPAKRANTHNAGKGERVKTNRPLMVQILRSSPSLRRRRRAPDTGSGVYARGAGAASPSLSPPEQRRCQYRVSRFEAAIPTGAARGQRAWG